MKRNRIGALAWLLLSALSSPAAAASDSFQLQQLDSAQAPLEQRIASGQGVAWVFRRYHASSRGQTTIDGIIIAPSSGLKLKAIQRDDGYHLVLLGESAGKPGEPISTLQKILPDARREHLVAHRLLAEGKEWAILYVPHGARLVASPRNGAALIELELPWESPKRFLLYTPSRPKGSGS